jgi:hypothetical protein
VRLSVATVFDCPAERVWDELQRTRVLRYVSWPILAFTWEEPPSTPEYWDRPKHLVRLWFLGIVPLWRQWIVVSFPRPEDHSRGIWRLRDDGSGALVHRWDHVITLTRRADGRCGYRDDLDMSAGLLTPVIWMFGWVFYRYRQWRWNILVASGFSYPSR